MFGTFAGRCYQRCSPFTVSSVNLHRTTIATEHEVQSTEKQFFLLLFACCWVLGMCLYWESVVLYRIQISIASIMACCCCSYRFTLISQEADINMRRMCFPLEAEFNRKTFRTHFFIEFCLSFLAIIGSFAFTKMWPFIYSFLQFQGRIVLNEENIITSNIDLSGSSYLPFILSTKRTQKINSKVQPKLKVPFMCEFYDFCALVHKLLPIKGFLSKLHWG